MAFTVPTKGRYAVRIMVDIAQNGKDRNVTAKEISERQNITIKYTEQIVGMLKRGGLLTSTQGVNGGYQLAAAPSEITINEILTITLGPFEPTKCAVDGKNCPNFDKCATAVIWQRYYKAVTEAVGNFNLQFVLDEAEQGMSLCVNVSPNDERELEYREDASDEY